MPRATVEESTAELGQNLRTGAPHGEGEISGWVVTVAWVFTSVTSQVGWVGRDGKMLSFMLRRLLLEEDDDDNSQTTNKHKFWRAD